MPSLAVICRLELTALLTWSSARSYLRHDWHTAVNGYWGPLYSWLLAIGMRFFHPGIHTEFAMARTLNFALFTAAVFTFSRFWRALADWSKRISDDENSIPYASPLVWIGLGYLLFVVNFIWNVDEVTPDILVATIVFAIAAVLFKLNFKLNDNRQHSIVAYVWLGLLLALGYYAKAILLYFAVFVLGAMLIQGFRSRILRGAITAVIVFVVLVAPFVVILSRTVGHFTAGDAGRLNYAWFVNGPETKTWMKVSSGYAPLPFYPGSIALDSPRVFRLPSIEGVTYAPWYDAARFDKRSHPAFDLRAQLRQLAVNLQFLKGPDLRGRSGTVGAFADSRVVCTKGVTPPLCRHLVLYLARGRRGWDVFACPLGATIRAWLFAGTLGCRLGVGSCGPGTATLGTPGNAGWDPCLCCLYDAGSATLRRFTAHGIGRARHGYCRGHFPTRHRAGRRGRAVSATGKKPIGRSWQGFQLWLKFGRLIPRGSGRRNRPCSRQSFTRWRMPARKRWFGAPIPIDPAPPVALVA